MSQPCTKCRSKPAIYHRPYSGERLCRSCFNETLLERVRKTISKHKMFQWNSRIAVGVSGGKDSLALLHMLSQIEEEYPHSELVALSVDEGVEGYRDEALALAREACRELGVEMVEVGFQELFGVTIDGIASQPRELGVCSYCGVLRRRALNEAAKKVGADVLATGHNLDDMAQTVLLNVLRGDHHRLNQFDPGGSQVEGFVRRVKPLCQVPERETTLYAYLNGLRFQSHTCPYAGEAMRNDVRRFLNQMEEKRPGTKFMVYRTGLRLKAQGEPRPIGRCTLCGAPSPQPICRSCQLVKV